MGDIDTARFLKHVEELSDELAQKHTNIVDMCSGHINQLWDRVRALDTALIEARDRHDLEVKYLEKQLVDSGVWR